MRRAVRARSLRAARRIAGAGVVLGAIAFPWGAPGTALAGADAGPPPRAARARLLAVAEPAGAARAVLAPRRLDSRSWLADALSRPAGLRLDGGATLPLLGRYAHPERVRVAPWQRFWAGRYGPSRRGALSPLTWSAFLCDPGTAAAPAPFTPRPPSLSAGDLGEIEHPHEFWPELAPAPAWLHGAATPAPELVPFSRAPACAPWQRHKPATFLRHGLERDTFALLDCDGSISAEAIDRLSAMARPLDVPRPPLPLPAEAARDAGPGEWTPGIRLVHPRLVWVMQQVADRFPFRAIYVVSGYRPGATRSQHARGRALDVQVLGISKERLFALCHELRDVACGYYPYHEFVHFDVREAGSGHPLWVDASLPGEPSRYVDAWPGVVEAGALEHQGEL